MPVVMRLKVLLRRCKYLVPYTQINLVILYLASLCHLQLASLIKAKLIESKAHRLIKYILSRAILFFGRIISLCYIFRMKADSLKPALGISNSTEFATLYMAFLVDITKIYLLPFIAILDKSQTSHQGCELSSLAF